MITFKYSCIKKKLNVVLKGLKQDTSSGCNECDVCDGNVIMFNPKFFAYFIAFKVTW
jgi:hypothetical protein